MASALGPLPPLPPPSEPVTDASGRMTRHWYDYLTVLDKIMRDYEARLTAGGL